MCLEMPRFVGYYFYKKNNAQELSNSGFFATLGDDWLKTAVTQFKLHVNECRKKGPNRYTLYHDK